MTSEVPSKGLEWSNLVLGAGLACAAFAFAELPAAAWNAGIVGVLIACCSAVALYRYGAWAEWSNVALGCWASSCSVPAGLRIGTGGDVDARPRWALRRDDRHHPAFERPQGPDAFEHQVRRQVMS